MNKLTIIIATILFLGLMTGFIIGNSGKEDGKKAIAKPTPITKSNCVTDDCLIRDVEYPVAGLPQEVISVLDQAIKDEYKAYATYKGVINKFGNVRPFIMIIRAEQQHIASLEGIYDKYGLDIPENDLINNVDIPTSIQAACSLGVDAEIANVNLYKNKLLPLVTSYPDITLVFTNLMNASEQKHLPAFMKCD